MPEENLNPYPSQAESDEMQRAAVTVMPLGQPVLAAREGEDLTPVMTQAQNDLAMLVAAGPSPDSLPPMCKSVPYVGGDATVGGTLTCTMGNWTGMGESTDYAYAWSGTGVATAENYVVGAADAGTEITCTVTATNANGSTTAPPSNAVAIGAAAADGGTHHRRGR